MTLAQISVRIRPDAVAALRRIAGAINRQPGLEDAMLRQIGDTAMPPSRRLGAAVARLRALGPSLKARGLLHCWVYGSVARGEDGPHSDIDLAVDLRAGSLSLSGFAELRAELGEALETPVDLAVRTRLKKHVARGFAGEAVALW